MRNEQLFVGLLGVQRASHLPPSPSHFTPSLKSPCLPFFAPHLCVSRPTPRVYSRFKFRSPPPLIDSISTHIQCTHTDPACFCSHSRIITGSTGLQSYHNCHNIRSSSALIGLNGQRVETSGWTLSHTYQLSSAREWW